MTCRKWLSDNGYKDVVNLIDEAMVKMAARGSKQRRNWWDILSGGAEGKPCLCEGVEFPVLRVAQKRQGKQITKNAVSRKSREQPPELLDTGRWKKEQSRPKSRPSSSTLALQEHFTEATHRRAS